MLLLPISHTPFNSWWARFCSSKLAPIPTSHFPFFSFLNTAHLPNLVTLWLPNVSCTISRGPDHIAYTMVERVRTCLYLASLMLTGQETRRTMLPLPALCGPLVEVP